jgi:hypothetical protein
MSYYSEHLKLKPVLEKAREFDIATNPAPEALFEDGNAGFQIWCSPEDHPTGWEGVPMDAGAFSKPCEYVASAHWGWDGETEKAPTITHLLLSTDAYALSDFHGQGRYNYHNRPEDLVWAQEKIHWLFQQASVPLPPIRTEA